MVQWICSVKRCGLFAEMGLGKTIATLTAIAELIASGEVERVLIIAPKRVALKTWPDEITQWEHVSWLTFTQLTGLTPRKRRAALRETTDIHIINRDTFVWLVNELGDAWPYDMVVIDEFTSFKNPGSARFKKMRKVARSFDRVVGLTGSPAPNGLLNLWSQIFVLDLGQRLSKAYTSYKQRYFFSDYHGYNWYLRDGSEEKIHEKIEDICLSMKAEDYLEVPDDIVVPVVVDLDAKTRKHYRDMQKEMLIELDNDDTITALQESVVTQKLTQITNGVIYNTEEETIHILHDEKLTALETIVEEANGMPILVAYSLTADRDRIITKFGATHLDSDPTTIDRWNRGEIPMLVAHPASCGHGLNLQHGSNILVWFGLTWDLELYMQMNARIGSLRQKQAGLDRPGFIYQILARDTIDDQIMVPRLEQKFQTDRRLMTALRDHLLEGA